VIENASGRALPEWLIGTDASGGGKKKAAPAKAR